MKKLEISPFKKGITQIATSSFFTVLMGVFVKLLKHTVPNSNLLVYRALVQGMFCIVIAKLQNVNLMGPKEHKKLLNTRGILGGFQIYLYFSTMTFLPIAMATALFMTTPIYTLALGAIFLKELITLRKSLAVLVSIVGIILVSHPNTWSSNPHDFYGSLCAIGEAVTTSFIVIVIKKIGSVHYSVLVFYLSIYMLVIGICLSFADGFVSLNGNQFFLVIMCCICAFMGQALLNAGVQKVSSVVSMTVRSLDVVFAFVFGILLGDEITAPSIMGSLLVLVGSYMVASAPTQQLPMHSTKEEYVQMRDDDVQLVKSGELESEQQQGMLLSNKS